MKITVTKVMDDEGLRSDQLKTDIYEYHTLYCMNPGCECNRQQIIS